MPKLVFRALSRVLCLCVLCDMLERFSNNCPNPKQFFRPIATGVNRAMNQSESLAMTCNLLKARKKSRLLRACLYGLVYPRQPSPRDNFTKRLYENCVTEPQLTLVNYAYILRRNKHHHLPLFVCSSSFIKYSCVFTFGKWTNTSIF